MNKLTVSMVLLLAACSRNSGRVMIQNKGSDTMVNLAQAWAEQYRTVSPNVAIAVSGGGSGTGIAALMNGTADIANASREIKDKERETAKKNTGKDVIEHVVAFDALAVYVHPTNPIASISRQQLACIYSEKGACTKWPDLGVEVPDCPGQEIIRVSRQNNSGTYVYFREWALGEGQDFKMGSRDMQGSKDVVDLVQHTPCAIGYSGLGYKTATVKAVCVTADGTSPCVEPTLAAAVAGDYPISRALYMYTLGQPAGATADFLAWIRTDAAQATVEQIGYAPLQKERR